MNYKKYTFNFIINYIIWFSIRTILIFIKTKKESSINTDSSIDDWVMLITIIDLFILSGAYLVFFYFINIKILEYNKFKFFLFNITLISLSSIISFFTLLNNHTKYIFFNEIYYIIIYTISPHLFVFFICFFIKTYIYG